MSQLLKSVKAAVAVTLIAAASNTDTDTVIYDMSEFDGIMFITPITVETNTGTAKLEVFGAPGNAVDTGAVSQGSVTATSTGANLAGTAIVVDVVKPLKRYVYATITSGVANMTFGPTIAIQYMAHNKPTVQDATVFASTVAVGV